MNDNVQEQQLLSEIGSAVNKKQNKLQVGNNKFIAFNIKDIKVLREVQEEQGEEAIEKYFNTLGYKSAFLPRTQRLSCVRLFVKCSEEKDLGDKAKEKILNRIGNIKCLGIGGISRLLFMFRYNRDSTIPKFEKLLGTAVDDGLILTFLLIYSDFVNLLVSDISQLDINNLNSTEDLQQIIDLMMPKLLDQAIIKDGTNEHNASILKGFFAKSEFIDKVSSEFDLGESIQLQLGNTNSGIITERFFADFESRLNKTKDGNGDNILKNIDKIELNLNKLNSDKLTSFPKILKQIQDTKDLFGSVESLRKFYDPVSSHGDLLETEKNLEYVSNLRESLGKVILDKVVYTFHNNKNEQKNVTLSELLDIAIEYFMAYRFKILEFSGQYNIVESENLEVVKKRIEEKLGKAYENKSNDLFAEYEYLATMLEKMDQENLEQFERYAAGLDNNFDVAKLSRLAKILKATDPDIIAKAGAHKSRDDLEKEFHAVKAGIKHYLSLIDISRGATPYNRNILIKKCLKDKKLMDLVINSEKNYSPEEIAILEDPDLALEMSCSRMNRDDSYFFIKGLLQKYEDRLFLAKLDNKNRDIFAKFCDKIGAKKFEGYDVKAVFIKRFIQEIADVLNKAGNVNSEFDKYDFDVLADDFVKKCTDLKLDDIQKTVEDCIDNKTDLDGINLLRREKGKPEVTLNEQQKLLFNSLMAVKRPSITYGKSKGIFIGSAALLGAVCIGIRAVGGAALLGGASWAFSAITFAATLLTNPIGIAVCAAVGLALLASLVVSATFLNKGIKKETTRLTEKAKGQQNIQRKSEEDIEEIMHIPFAEHRRAKLLKRVDELKNKMGNYVDQEIGSLTKKIENKINEVKDLEKYLEKKVKTDKRYSDMLEDIRDIEGKSNDVTNDFLVLKPELVERKNDLKQKLEAIKKDLEQLEQLKGSNDLVHLVDKIEANFKDQEAKFLDDIQKLIKTIEEKIAMFESKFNYEHKKLREFEKKVVSEEREFLNGFSGNLDDIEVDNSEVIDKELSAIEEYYMNTVRGYAKRFVDLYSTEKQGKQIKVEQGDLLGLRDYFKITIEKINELKNKISETVLNPKDKTRFEKEIKKFEDEVAGFKITVDVRRFGMKNEFEQIVGNIEGFEILLNQYKEVGDAGLKIFMEQFYNRIEKMIDKVSNDIEKSEFVFPESKVEITNKLDTLKAKANSLKDEFEKEKKEQGIKMSLQLLEKTINNAEKKYTEVTSLEKLERNKRYFISSLKTSLDTLEGMNEEIGKQENKVKTKIGELQRKIKDKLDNLEQIFDDIKRVEEAKKIVPNFVDSIFKDVLAKNKGVDSDSKSTSVNSSKNPSSKSIPNPKLVSNFDNTKNKDDFRIGLDKSSQLFPI